MSICFATMAVGEGYVELAKKLICDIRRYFPETPIYVLTDKPKSFAQFQNIYHVAFRRTGFWCIYHDKRKAMEAALQNHQACLFLDADCRLVDRPPIESYEELVPGVYGAYLQTFRFRFDAEIGRYKGSERFLKNTPKRRARLLQIFCNEFGVDFWQCKYLQEAAVLLVFQREHHRFFRIWEYIGVGLSTKLFEEGEGYVFGIAAEHLGLAIAAIPKIDQWLFKDILTPAAKAILPVYRPLVSDRIRVTEQFKMSPWGKARRNLSALCRFFWFMPFWYVSRRAKYRQLALGADAYDL